MTAKRYIWENFIRLLNYSFIHRKSRIKLNIEPSDFYLVTVAFNNDFLINQQIKLVKKHITDKNFLHIIADNSTDRKKRAAIQYACQREKVGYIALPYNIWHVQRKMVSYSHGFALNWMYYNVIAKNKPRYFGFIDHDLFPIKSYSVEEQLQHQDFYGYLNPRFPPAPYLWAGFCFYQLAAICNKRLNFLPALANGCYLDTGGANYAVLYKKANLNAMKFAKAKLVNIGNGKVIHKDYVQYFDESWLHAINGSNWAKVGNKNEQLKKILGGD
jgi:hypothetical protein